MTVSGIYTPADEDVTPSGHGPSAIGSADVVKHTPTPWRADGPPPWTHYGEKWRAKHLVLGADGQVVANTYTEAERDPEADANTSLIVAAVNAYAQMIKALRKIADLRYVEDANEPFDEALDIADAALASLQREALAEEPCSEGVDNKDRAP